MSEAIRRQRGQPPKGKVAITYRYQPTLPVYQHLLHEAERRGTSLQEEIDTALDAWFNGNVAMEAIETSQLVSEDGDADGPSVGHERRLTRLCE